MLIPQTFKNEWSDAEEDDKGKRVNLKPTLI